jgi:hypothetical protein
MLPFQSTSEKETVNVYNAEVGNVSLMVIYSQGVTIQHGGTYPMMVIVIHNVGRAILDTDLTNGHILNGTSTSSDKINSMNCAVGIKNLKNIKTLNWKNY